MTVCDACDDFVNYMIHIKNSVTRQFVMRVIYVSDHYFKLVGLTRPFVNSLDLKWPIYELLCFISIAIFPVGKCSLLLPGCIPYQPVI